MKWTRVFLFFFTLFYAAAGGATPPQSVPLGELVVYPQHSALASVVAKNNSQISTEVSGQVQAIWVDVGDRVDKGEPLLQLDDFNYRQQQRQRVAAIEGTEARIAFAEFQLQQSQRLGKSHNISEELLRQRQTNLVVLKAELRGQQAQRDQLQRSIDDGTVKAPFSGVIVERQVQLGERVTPGTPLLRLLANEGQQVRADLHPQDAQYLHQGSELTFVSGNKQYPLRLNTRLPMLHPQQRTQQVRLSFIHETALVGASGRLEWRDHRPALPAAYLQRRNGELGIFTLRQGEAIFVPLPGAQEGRSVKVDQLPLTTEVVLDNLASLRVDS
ncbi:MAG: efflux RND transporter periplasmic adaptor subunit [Gammaproteobacteria bacterium]|nr:efflux RND transporter periplasmic adaptor subunit [Gammaproteobacteria bacterium]